MWRSFGSNSRDNSRCGYFNTSQDTTTTVSWGAKLYKGTNRVLGQFKKQVRAILLNKSTYKLKTYAKLKGAGSMRPK